MTAQNKNIPELRFPEFISKWEKKPLIDLSENGFSNGAFNDPKKVGSGYRIINVKDMYVDGTINVNNLTRVAIDKKEFLKNRVEFGDIFFTRSSLVKEGIAYSNVNLNDSEDLTFDGHLIRLRPKKEKCSPIFLYYNFATSNARIQFIERGKTTTMTTIGQEDIATVEILLPSLPEQQKIASFLTAIDEKLQALKQKKTLLEQYKKGLMQKIFSQELRFKDKDGNAFPKWEKKKLGEVCNIFDGTHQTPDYKEQGIPFYSVEHVTSNNFSETKYISTDIFEKENKRVKLEKGDILMTRIGDIGTPKYIDWDVNASFYVSLALIKKSKNSNNEFIFHVINSTFFQSELHKRTIHVAFPKKINLGEIGECLVFFPCLQEQTKIANFLSPIVEKIKKCSVQIEKTEQYKKGLLQKMFI